MRFFFLFLLLLGGLVAFTCDWNRGFVQEKPSMSDLVGFWKTELFAEWDREKYGVSGQMHFRLNKDGTVSDVNLYRKPARGNVSHVSGDGKWRLNDANPGGLDKNLVLRWEIVLSFSDPKIEIRIPIKRIRGKMALYYSFDFDALDIPFFKNEEQDG